MNTRTGLGLAALALIPGTGAAEEKYTSKDGKFAIRFPTGAAVKLDKKDSVAWINLGVAY